MHLRQLGFTNLNLKRWSTSTTFCHLRESLDARNQSQLGRNYSQLAFLLWASMIVERPILSKLLEDIQNFLVIAMAIFLCSSCGGLWIIVNMQQFCLCDSLLVFCKFVVCKFQYHCVEKIYHNVHTHHGSNGMFKFYFFLQISRDGLSYMCIFI